MYMDGCYVAGIERKTDKYMRPDRQFKFHHKVTHWSAYRLEVKNGKVFKVHDLEDDQDPSPIYYGE